jgi:hypothetical protein
MMTLSAARTFIKNFPPKNLDARLIRRWRAQIVSLARHLAEEGHSKRDTYWPLKPNGDRDVDITCSYTCSYAKAQVWLLPGTNYIGVRPKGFDPSRAARWNQNRRIMVGFAAFSKGLDD